MQFGKMNFILRMITNLGGTDKIIINIMNQNKEMAAFYAAMKDMANEGIFMNLSIERPIDYDFEDEIDE